MIRIFAALFMLLATIGLGHAQGAGVGTVGVNGCKASGPPLDANGYTVFNQPNSAGGGGRKYYVSSSLPGNDSWDGLYPDHSLGGSHGPFLTIAHGITVLRGRVHGYTGPDDWLLLKKGDAWTLLTATDTLSLYFNGQDCEHPALIGAYPETPGTGARPLIRCGNHCFQTYGGTYSNFIAVAGIQLYGYQRDPINNYAEYTPNIVSFGYNAFLLYNVTASSLLIEDIEASYLGLFVGHTPAGGFPATGINLRLRKNVVHNMWFGGGFAYICCVSNFEEVDNTYYYGYIQNGPYPITIDLSVDGTTPSVFTWTSTTPQNLLGSPNGVNSDQTNYGGDAAMSFAFPPSAASPPVPSSELPTADVQTVSGAVTGNRCSLTVGSTASFRTSVVVGTGTFVVTGTGACDGTFPATILGGNLMDLQTSSFSGPYTGPGTVTLQQNISGAVNNGVGLCRITVGSTDGIVNGGSFTIAGITGATGCNGTRLLTVIDDTTLDLQGTTFGGSYSGSGTATATTSVSNAVAHNMCSLTVGSTTGLATGTRVTIAGIAGATGTACNGVPIITTVDGTTLDLQGTTFAGSYSTGGTVTFGLHYFYDPRNGTQYCHGLYCYYAINIGTCAGCGGDTNKFNVSMIPCVTNISCKGGIVINSCTGACSLSQNLVVMLPTQGVTGHVNYLQNDPTSVVNTTGPIIMTGNIWANGSGDGACQCITGGYVDNNLFVNNAIAGGIGKGNSAQNPWYSYFTNNVILQGSPLPGYGEFEYSQHYNFGGYGFGWGIVPQGPAIIENNITAHALIGGTVGFSATVPNSYIFAVGAGVDPTVSSPATFGLVNSGGAQSPNMPAHDGDPVFFFSGTTLPTCTSGCGAADGSPLKNNTQAGVYYLKNFKNWNGAIFRNPQHDDPAVLVPVPVSITLGTTTVINWPSHGLSVGTPIMFKCTGVPAGTLCNGGTDTLPSPIVSGWLAAVPDQFPENCDGPPSTCYFVLHDSNYDADHFSISATKGGTAVDTSAGSQSGQHYAVSMLTTTFQISSTPGGAVINTTCIGACATATSSFAFNVQNLTYKNNITCDWRNALFDPYNNALVPSNTFGPNVLAGNYSNAQANANQLTHEMMDGIPNYPTGCDGAYPNGLNQAPYNIASAGNQWNNTPSHTVAFPYPNLSLATYDCDVLGNCPTPCPGISMTGNCGSMAHFFSLANLQRKETYDARLTANAVNNYIRAGFGMSYQ